MMYLALFFAGALVCNAIPHLVTGLTGQRFFTPWAKPRGVGLSSPLENALWGSANLVVGVGIVTRTASQNVPHGLVAIAAGFVLGAIGLSIVFGRRVAR